MSVDDAFWSRLADVATAASLPHFRSGVAVDNKLDAGFDPVTIADREVERELRAIIRAECPADGILGEEFGADAGTSGRRWVIDPIDGTRAFVAGIPVWMTLVGLEENGRSVAGLACQPVTGERFVARSGRGTVTGPQGSRALRTSPVAPGDAVLMTTAPELLDGSAEAAFRAMSGTARLTRYSADAYAFCALAAGAVHVVIEKGVAPYDVGAVIPIVEAAGGSVTTWSGERAEPGGTIVATASPELHEWALGHLRAVADAH